MCTRVRVSVYGCVFGDIKDPFIKLPGFHLEILSVVTGLTLVCEMNEDEIELKHM